MEEDIDTLFGLINIILKNQSCIMETLLTPWKINRHLVEKLGIRVGNTEEQIDNISKYLKGLKDENT